MRARRHERAPCGYSTPMPTELVVFLAALLTAVTTGLGVLPLLVGRARAAFEGGIGSAVAAGLMLAASAALLHEGWDDGSGRLLLGALAGGVVVAITTRVANGTPITERIGSGGRTGTTALVLIAVMTVHSFAEGVGIGVAFGPDGTLGWLVTITLAIHNIPEGLAIALALRPTGASLRACAGWAVVSSLPQPLIAVPSFAFVEVARGVLPVGLGFAAGAMVWMVASSVLPEALEDGSRPRVLVAAGSSAVLMLGVQTMLT